MYPPFSASWQMAIRPYITFPQAPLRSRTVGSPESGSDLGFSSDGLPKAAEAQMLVHIHPAPFRFARQTRSDNRLRIPRCARPCVRIAPAADPPSAQSPFARDKALPSPVRVSRTPSAGITLPSSLLRAHAPVLPLPRASVLPLHTASLHVSSLRASAFPDLTAGRRSTNSWTATSVQGVSFGAVASSFCSGPPVCSPPRWLPPPRPLGPVAAVASTSEHPAVRYLPPVRIC